MNRGSYVGGGWQWDGGFVRVCARDTATPTTPTALSATIEGSGARLSWVASSDDRGAVAYEVLRDHRAIATVRELPYLDPALADLHRHPLRSLAPARHRSTSPPVPGGAPIPDTARRPRIKPGADWAWRQA